MGLYPHEEQSPKYHKLELSRDPEETSRTLALFPGPLGALGALRLVIAKSEDECGQWLYLQIVPLGGTEGRWSRNKG